MKSNDATRASGEDLPSIGIRVGRVQTALARARSLNELIFMAGESIDISSERDAITTGCDVLDKMIVEIDEMLEDLRLQEGGAA